MISTTEFAGERPVEEGLVEIGGHGYYAIPDVHTMPPFLMSVVSDGDRWMFLSSTGGLTAGRGDASGALFPYETDDRLHRNAGAIGPVTAIRLPGVDAVWSPFRSAPPTGVSRTLYKSVVGDSVLFEETNLSLGLTFRYRWASSHRFGFVRTATLVNEGGAPSRVDLIDGLLGILPYGLDPAVYQRMSNLTNAYKRGEIIDARARLAVYSLESRIADRTEPEEVLRTSIAWSTGLPDAELTLHPDALGALESGHPSESVSLMTGSPAGYLLRSRLDLPPGAQSSWHIVADVAQDQRSVTALRNRLRVAPSLDDQIEASLREATRSLVQIMAPADALQHTGDRVATAHQFANVTYNVMRGGVPLDGYRIPVDDFSAFVRERNRQLADRHQAWFDSLPAVVERSSLMETIQALGDAHLVRLAFEYLPFTFSRRHGDPSRPWNAFSIRVRDAEDRPNVYYEGNWRDIFQNWEALSMSFPEYLPSMISVFVNASTPDGFNPYRINRHGIDWEIPDPDDPWSNIGYWGDHQVVYLLRLLEACDRYLPGWVETTLGEQWFSYADVPYRLADYDELVENPKSTITYDEEAARRSAARVEATGGDGKLLCNDDHHVYLASLLEKLVVPALSKLSNFVPGGGIWMNTQRPEWNDANNALVGFGLSMVTLYHLRRYLDHLRDLVRSAGLRDVEISTEVAEWLATVRKALDAHSTSETRLSDGARKALMDQLGQAFAEYRTRVYQFGFSGRTKIATETVAALCDTALEHLDATIRHGRRADGLFHSYNLVQFGSDRSTAAVDHLHEMLEGQVAALDSGFLTPDERLEMIDALFESSLYREDQRSFVLYPPHRPPSFLDKNVIPIEAIAGNRLLTALIAEGDESVVLVDDDGRHRFNADLSNREDLEEALKGLSADARWDEIVAEGHEATLATYEGVFQHHSYTGRSGSMYGYEGIGSIYWHMVAKLLVAIQESVLDAASRGADRVTLRSLVDAYWRVRSGLGFNKTAKEFGAIPLDPYSHSPAHAGAQQPGMTGLVKEELLTRPLEVAVRVDSGAIELDSTLLRRSELLSDTETWQLFDLDLHPSMVEIPAGSLGLTVCQVPVIVSTTSDDPQIEIHRRDGSTSLIPGTRIDPETSAQIFGRTGEIDSIRAAVLVSEIGSNDR